MREFNERNSVDFLERLDNWMFDAVFEKFAHRFQRFTGRDNFSLARYVVVSYFFYVVWCDMSKYAVAAVVSQNGATALITLFVIHLVEKHAKSQMGNTRERLMNRWRKDPLVSSLRELLLLGTIIFMGKFTLIVLLYGRDDIRGIVGQFKELAQFYLICCTPLPPSESLVSKWLASLREALSPAQPDPVPS